MNETQTAMAKKVSTIVGEHFSHALLVFASDEMDDDDFICLRFFGGALTAVGMADYAKGSINNMLSGATSSGDDDDLDSKEFG
tara:strand:+ start:5287 stop:5535 length:249 start_codon:yes stop_codon:yes gene_type:complete